MAYLLRLWQVRGEDGMAWRASLESARTGERVGFASLQDLFAFLEQEVCQNAQGETAPNRDSEGELQNGGTTQP